MHVKEIGMRFNRMSSASVLFYVMSKSVENCSLHVYRLPFHLPLVQRYAHQP